jgi:hypothetical protein
MVGEQCVMLTCLPSWFSKTLCAVVVMANGDDSFDSADAGRAGSGGDVGSGDDEADASRAGSGGGVGSGGA